MQARVVDERDVTIELERPVFRVHDILDEDACGPVAVRVTEVTGATVTEVLAWVRSDRGPSPVRSEVRCLVAGLSDDVATVLLDTVTRDTSERE